MDWRHATYRAARRHESRLGCHGGETAGHACLETLLLLVRDLVRASHQPVRLDSEHADGAPFVANLRLEWTTWFRMHPEKTPVVVQLLGDIDDIVSGEDNKDLRAAAGTNFFWLKVRGTGHADIVDFDDTAGRTASYAGIGDYRRSKFLLAVKGTPAELEAQTEEQPPGIDLTVDHIVFVLHGIRDLGEWSADFEEQLRAIDPGTPTERLKVVPMHYGHFSMASFLFRPDRQKFVRCLMDQYTETLARYPNAKTIDFFGHSNGTYLLASALQEYESMKIRRIVFAGSVVRRDYDWSRIFARDQVAALRNYVATGDAVVVLFPRFFEPKVMRWLGNDVGVPVLTDSNTYRMRSSKTWPSKAGTQRSIPKYHRSRNSSRLLRYRPRVTKPGPRKDFGLLCFAFSPCTHSGSCGRSWHLS